ncbi:MAG: tetratricopeptide repeat protein [Longimicrobiales bacterium]
MSLRLAHMWRSGFCFGGSLFAMMVLSGPLTGQQLGLKRDYPGSGPYECPISSSAQLPTSDEQSRARQLGTDANLALTLGDYERVEDLLSQAIELDPSSPDLAFRLANVLEDLDESEEAILSYCRAIELGVEDLGVGDVRVSIAILWAQVLDDLPSEARDAFANGLRDADLTLYLEAIEDFTLALEFAPGWADPIYNRGVLNELVGNQRQALADFRAYLIVVANPEAADAIAISERIGLLEGAASIETPSPTQALALGALPGMGYYYTRQPIPGTITLAAAGGAIAAGFLFKNVRTLCLAETSPGASCPPEDIVNQVTEQPYRWYGIGAAAVITIAGAVDAYLKAKRARATAEALTGPPETESGGFSIGIPTVSTYRDQIDLSIIRYRFR